MAAVATSSVVDEPNPAMITSASNLLGMETTVSSVRDSAASSQPPLTAASSPSPAPKPHASTVAAKATPSVYGAPAMMRVSMSRPR